MLFRSVSANNPAFDLFQQAVVALILVIVLGITYVFLRSAEQIQHWIGRTGSLILSRVMGIILTAIATETVIQAITKLMSQSHP